MSSPSNRDRLGALLERTPPFNILEEEHRNGLISSMTGVNFEAGAVILEQGVDIHKSLYVIEEGLVRLMNVEEKRLIDMCGPSSQFGSFGIIQGGILPYEARAVEDTSCQLIPAEKFRALLNANEEFESHFDEDIKRYVRTIDTALDASGAFLLFDTALSRLSREALLVGPEASVRDAATAMSDADADTVVVIKDTLAVGVITEGDIVEYVVVDGHPSGSSIMDLVKRPAVALNGSERLFDAVQAMMRHRIRRVVVVDEEDENGKKSIGILSSDDVSHYRGLDPVATIELIERARSVEVLASLREESNRRLMRLYQQGVQSEDLLSVIAELDDQIKRRALHLVEKQLREEHPEKAVDTPWTWLVFGTAGRRESTIDARQHSGLVYANDAPDKAQDWFFELATRATKAFETCGYARSVSGILASNETFCQPLSKWLEMYQHWASGADPVVTAKAVVTLDARRLAGEETLLESIKETLFEIMPNKRLLSIIVQQGADINIPISVFNRFQLEKNEDDEEGFNLRVRGLRPIVDFARAMALEIGYLKSSNTFDRLRAVAESESQSAPEARSLIAAMRTLSDLHLRLQMQAADVGEDPGDWIDPGKLHKSQQNLLKESLKNLQGVKQSMANRYVMR